MVGMRQFDEQEMIATALDVFWRKGLHDATMQDLAAATGVQRGSLYNAYGDKEAIFLRAFDQYAGQFLDSCGQALAEGDTCGPLKELFRCDHREYDKRFAAAGLPDHAHRARWAISSTAVRQRVQGVLSRLEQLVSKAISSVPGKRLATNANRLARVVVTFTRGLAVMERAGYTRKQLKESAATFVDALVGDV